MHSSPTTTRRPTRDRRRDRAAALACVRRLSRMSTGDPRHDALREHVIAEYMPYARHIAGRHGGDRTQDVVQVAYVGLIKAVDNYDADYGTTFLTYATPMISGEIKRHFRDTTWAVHVPRHMQELTRFLRKANETLTHRYGRSPTIDELADHLKVDPMEVIEAIDAAEAYDTSSLDMPINAEENDGARLGDLIGEDDPGIDLVVQRESLKPLLAELTAREKRILLMRFFRNMTQAQIGAELGVSQMQISRLLSQILGRLRRQAGEPTAAAATAAATV